ncbi:MAG: hypothetical protein MI725_06015 [Pirellulales bacterium]|nr:hypothetical protein [Pirellulales bacterium]
MTKLQQRYPLPTSIVEKLTAVRDRAIKVRVATAVVTALVVLFASMSVAMLVDWLATLYDPRWRAVLTATACAAAGITLMGWGVLVWRRFRYVDRVAADVDREIPELEERWSTVTRVAAGGNSGRVHPAMYRKVAEEAHAWTPRVEVAQVVRIDGLLRALVCLTAVTAVLFMAVLLDSQRTVVMLRRFWSPLTMISATEVSDLPGNIVVGRGESLQITGSLGGVEVEQATLMLKQSEDEIRSMTLVPRGENHQQLSHRLRSIKSPLQYRVRAGDGQSPWYEIVVADRPQLGEVRMQLTPPTYTRQEPKSLKKLPRRLTALEGTRLELALRPQQPVKSFSLKLKKNRREKDETILRLAPDSEGWYRWKTTLTHDFFLSVLLTELHGLNNRRPPICEIRCQRDQPPTVRILTPNRERVVHPDETIPITFVAHDDIGIQNAELVVYDDRPAGGEPVVLDKINIPLGDQQNATKVKATVDLDLSQYRLPTGSSLSFSVHVQEDRGQENSALASLGQEEANLPTEFTVTTIDSTAAAKPESLNDKPTESNKETIAEEPPSRMPSPSGSSTATDEKTQLNQSVAATTNTNTSQAEATNRKTIAPPTTDPTTATDSEVSSRNTDSTRSNESRASAAVASPSVAKNRAGQASESRLTATPAQDMRTAESTSSDSSQETDTAQNAVAPSRSATTQNRPNSDSPPTPSGNSTPPPKPMRSRSLDVVPRTAQSTASKRMRLKIDEWAGSYDSQRRNEIEILIAPKLAEIDQALEKAERLSRNVLDEIDAAAPWDNKHDRDIQAAQRQIATARKVIDNLKQETQDTPYAFVGLQLVDIDQAHIQPANREFWTVLESAAAQRVDSTRSGWQHVVRARELMVLLTERFERTRQSYKLAETAERIKKMYQIFVDGSLALLRPAAEADRYSRKMVEFELDEEFLKRLKEVEEMRNELRKELARVLAEDPRLLRRYLDVQRRRNKVLRVELERLIESQDELNREVKAWATVEQDQRSRLANILLGRHFEAAQDLAIGAADLNDRFETWLPLLRNTEDTDLKATIQRLRKITSASRELASDGLNYIDQSRRARKRDDSDTEDRSTVSNTELLDSVDTMLGDARQLHEHFVQLEVLLRQFAQSSEQEEIAFFATNRLLETRRMMQQTTTWIRQLKQHQSGNYHRVAEVSQYRLAVETDSLAGKLADVEQTFSALLQRNDSMLPETIAQKARGLLEVLDEKAAPNQLAAVYSLKQNEMPGAMTYQEDALTALHSAGKFYDEMIEAAIKELDKLPVQDPLDPNDPTLDQLLAALEQEVSFREALGIPTRPTNLHIMRDWMLGQAGNVGNNGGSQRLVVNQFRRRQMLRQRQLDRAYRRAIARAMKEASADDLVPRELLLARDHTDWNLLLSQLEDELQQDRGNAPPERYRRAIEQYFRQVSGSQYPQKEQE